MSKRELLKLGYEIKHSPVGFWVDGAQGYCVAGYFDTEREAVEAAGREIERVSKLKWNQKPAWWRAW